MKRWQQTILVLVIAGMTAACTSSTKLILANRLPERPNKVQHIMVYLGGPPIEAKPLAVVAIARRGANSVWAVEALKLEAAELGADAITNLNIAYTPGLLPEMRVEGLAVKYAQ